MPKVQLSSSGSFSADRFYYFGPIDGVLAVEKLLKGSPTVMVQMHSGTNGFYPIKNRKYTSLFAFDPKNNDFSKLWEHKGGLCAAPNVWLFLSKNKQFLKELGNSEITSISSTGWESFFDKSVYPVYVNNNMLNLKTGDGFYTCSFGNIHCLPFKLKIQGKVANLMNLGDKSLHSDDDDIAWEYRECPCGVRLPICTEKICHNKNSFRPKLELAPLLEGQYKNWQAVKTDECINWFLSGNYPKKDLEIMKEYLGDGRIWNGVRYRTGVNKWASFWSEKEIDDSRIEIF